MQALPRFYSTLQDGSDERDFLSDFFEDKARMLSFIFLKGYQWPFDVRKVQNGSSIIDLLVYLEISKGRRVFLDYRRDPYDESFSFSSLEEEAYRYLKEANALVNKPIERLRLMNKPAIDFYLDKGVDLEKEPLEIALCAQHNNGGLDLNKWWESNLKGFFVAGEVAGSHGIYRPGGSALNAGQVGSTRASEYINEKRRDFTQDESAFSRVKTKALDEVIDISEKTFGKDENTESLRLHFSSLMSKCGGAIRNKEEIEKLSAEVDSLLNNFEEKVSYNSPLSLKKVFSLRDMLLTQKCYLLSMLNYIDEGGKSRGSALYTDKNGIKPYSSLPDIFTFTLDGGEKDDLIQEMKYENNKCAFNWRKVRPIPQRDDFFENVWKGYRENKNID